MELKVELLIITLSVVAASTDIKFTQSLDCQSDTCQQWNQTTLIQYTELYSAYGCFSQEVYVQTPQGPKTLKDIKVGDRILSYNFQKQMEEYSQVHAWLHRDTDTLMEYIQIKTDSFTYSASKGHNIAVKSSTQNTHSFKFSQNVQYGDHLISLEHQDQVVVESSSGFQKGLYSPYTLNTNFYIFPKNSRELSSMILVHCLSEVDSPEEVTKSWFHSFMTSKIVNMLGLNSHQNAIHENYLHIGTYLLQFVSTFSEAQIKNQRILFQSSSDDFIEVGQYGNDEQRRIRNHLAVMLIIKRMNQVITFSN